MSLRPRSFALWSALFVGVMGALYILVLGGIPGRSESTGPESRAIEVQLTESKSLESMVLAEESSSDHGGDASIRVVASRGLSNSQTRQTEPHLTVYGEVWGKIEDAIMPLTVELISSDGHDSAGIHFSFPVDAKSPRYKFHIRSDRLGPASDARQVRLKLLEGNRVLNTLDIDDPSAAQLFRGKASSDVIIEKHLTFQDPSIVTGMLVDSSNDPVSDAIVFLLRVSETERSQVVSHSKSTGNGTFRLRVRDVARAIVGVSHQDFNIHSLTVQIPAEGVLDLGTIRLTSGVKIQGVLRFRYTDYPLGGTRIVAYPQMVPRVEDEPGTRHVLEGVLLRQRSAGIERESIESTCDNDGQFVIRGLKEGSYLLDWFQPNPPRNDVHRGSPRRSYPVRAPSAGVIIEDESPLVIVWVTQENQEIDGARVEVASYGESGVRLRTNALGRCYYFPYPNQRLFVSARAPGLARTVREVISPAAGAVTKVHLQLNRATQPSTLVLEVVDSQERPIPRITSAIVPVNTNLEDEAFLWVESSSDGKYVFENLEAAVYRVEVRSYFWNTTPRPLVPARLAVTLEPNKETHRRVRLEEGGQIEIETVEERSRAIVPARCSLWTSAGEQVVGWFHFPDFVKTHTSTLPPPISEGTYTVVAEHPDYETAKTTVTVEMGRRALAELKMKRK